jgi:WhiB family transcriptional regulator, redox-sensing transcriptional regulator
MWVMNELHAEQWMEQAVCRGAAPSSFFPSDGSGVEAAQRICDHCPVRAECLEYALEHRIEHGVWGGASERERRRILRTRRHSPSRASSPVETTDFELATRN